MVPLEYTRYQKNTAMFNRSPCSRTLFSRHTPASDHNSLYVVSLLGAGLMVVALIGVILRNDGKNDALVNRKVKSERKFAKVTPRLSI